MELNCGHKAAISKMDKAGYTEDRIAQKMGIPVGIVESFLRATAERKAKERQATANKGQGRYNSRYDITARPHVTLPKLKFLEGT